MDTFPSPTKMPDIHVHIDNDAFNQVSKISWLVH